MCKTHLLRWKLFQTCYRSDCVADGGEVQREHEAYTELTLQCVYVLPRSGRGTMQCRSVKRRIWWVLCQRNTTIQPLCQGKPMYMAGCSCVDPTSVTQCLPPVTWGFIQAFVVQMPFTDPATNLLHLFSFFYLVLVLCKLSELNRLMEGCTWSGRKKGDRNTAPVLLKWIERGMLERWERKGAEKSTFCFAG